MFFVRLPPFSFSLSEKNIESETEIGSENLALLGFKVATGAARISSKLGSKTAAQIIAQGEQQHKKEPEQAGDGGEMKEAAAAFHVHKKKHDQKHFREGDGERDNEIEDSEIDVAEAPGEGEEAHERRANRPVKSR
jgi:hypothetical protein